MKSCGGKERPTIVQAFGASPSSQCRIFEGVPCRGLLPVDSTIASRARYNSSMLESDANSPAVVPTTPGIWERYLMAIDEVTERRRRIGRALDEAQVVYALVGGQAVALWVATKDPAAVRTTKDVDILLRREDLPRARAAATAVALDYFEVAGVGMFLERADPNPRKGVHLLWSGEKVRPECPLSSPTGEERALLEKGQKVV